MPEIETAQFHRAVLALNGGASDARIVRLLASAATKTKIELIACPRRRDRLDAAARRGHRGRSEDVQQVLDSAEEIAEAFKVKLEPVAPAGARRRRGDRR
jgi:hypothetical protein